MLYAGSRLLTDDSLKEQFFEVLNFKDSDSARMALPCWIMAASCICSTIQYKKEQLDAAPRCFHFWAYPNF